MLITIKAHLAAGEMMEEEVEVEEEEVVLAHQEAFVVPQEAPLLLLEEDEAKETEPQ